jgi:CheY-like chemotaxis protein
MHWPKRLLLIEDNPGDVRLFREALLQCSLDIQMTVAETGDEALAVIARVAPHLIVLDLNMPGMDGQTVLRVLKTSKVTYMIPVVVFSSSANPRDVRETYVSGANCFLRKPQDLDAMLSILGEFCRVWLRIAQLPDPPAQSAM